jgi:hypothetical protein
MFTLIAIYGALRHPVQTCRAWWQTWQARRHPRQD